MVDFSSLRVRFLKYFYAWRVSLFLIGVVVSSRFANYSITGVYMDFLTGKWNTPIFGAAMVINLKEALTSLFSIVGANYAKHAPSGRYHAIRLSLLPFITGLGLFAFAASKVPGGAVVAVFCVSLLLTTIGEGMQKHTLFDFGYDQFKSQMEDEEKPKRQAYIWWNAGRLLGTVGGLIASTFVRRRGPKLNQDSWWVFGGILSCGLTAMTSIIYILGKRSFYKASDGVKNHPIIDVLKVVVAAVRKRHLPYATDPRSIYEEGRNPTTAGNATQREELQTTEGDEIMNEEKNQVERKGLAGDHNPAAYIKLRCRISFFLSLTLQLLYPDQRMLKHFRIIPIGSYKMLGKLNRCLEKASIIESPARIDIHERQWRLCSLTKVKNTELVLRLLPLWSTFLMFQVVNAMGDTFFLEQGKAMVGNVTVSILLAVQNGSQLHIGQVLLPLLKRVARLKGGIPPLVRIGIGLFISILCCIVSGIVERRRLEAHMSIFWLVPQCFLLGAAVGFAEDGISDFFDTRVPKDLRVCYRLISESVKGAGCLLNSLILAAVHLFSMLGTKYYWIGDDLKTGKLHIVYFMIAGMSTVNLFFYYIISRKYAAGSSQDQHPSLSADHPKPKEDQSTQPSRDDDSQVEWFCC